MPASPSSTPLERELYGLCSNQALLIEAQQAHIEELRARILKLEAQVRGNSKNSSRPPSSDGLAKPRTKSLRKKTMRPAGGQPGHEGSTLRQVENPDELVVHRPVECAGCGHRFGSDTQAVSRQHRQVFELPPIRAWVVGHDLLSFECGCGVITPAPTPVGVTSPVQYGPRLRAAVLYLYQNQFCAKARTAKTCSDLFGVPISSGSVANFQGIADGRLDRFMGLVKDQARRAGVLGCDETGMRVAGGNTWLHVARSELFTLLQVHHKRGVAAMRDNGVLEDYRGVLIRDALASYDTIAPRARHQLCGAHLARELVAVSEFLVNHPEYAGPCGWDWGGQVAYGLWEIKRACDQAVDGLCPPGVLAENRALMVSAGLIAARSGGCSPGVLGKKHRALARRVATRADDYLRFATTPGVGFDNNGSERDLRMVKLRMKVSGGLRTMDGANRFARLRSYLSTASKNQVNAYDALLGVFTGNTWLPAKQTT